MCEKRLGKKGGGVWEGSEISNFFVLLPAFFPLQFKRNLLCLLALQKLVYNVQRAVWCTSGCVSLVRLINPFFFS